MPVPVHSIGPVIGLHVGPGSIGIVYQFNKGEQ
ncbi:DegV family protein [Peptococcaceae bacterium]|nr:DegV family protein [Peptococcaceae bacterium]